MGCLSAKKVQFWNNGDLYFMNANYKYVTTDSETGFVFFGLRKSTSRTKVSGSPASL